MFQGQEPAPWPDPSNEQFLVWTLTAPAGSAQRILQHLLPGPRPELCYDLTFIQSGQLPLVGECRGSALIGREDPIVATPALLCHKDPAPRSKGGYFA